MTSHRPNTLSPDDLFAEIVAMIDGIAPHEREKMLARLVFALASEVKDPATVVRACRSARDAMGPGDQSRTSVKDAPR